MKVKLMKPRAKLPVRANPTDAGADLIAPEYMIIEPHSSSFMGLGIAIELPPNTVGYIFARSGIGSRNGIRPRNCVGVIDEKYFDEVGIMIENSSDYQYCVRAGDKIAQLVICPVLTPEFEEVDTLSKVEDRQGGFGSTGW